jgi:Flp pilus assembly protein TadG
VAHLRISTYRGCLARLVRARRGGTMILFSLSLPVLAGGLALGVETGVSFIQKRQLQTETDAAAVAAAYELAKGNTTTLDQIASNEAYRNGLDASMSPVITLNRPPTSGVDAGKTNAVEVVITIKQPPMFSAVFTSNPTTIKARAVAEVRIKANACVLATQPNGNNAALVTGTANVTLQDCALASNSETTTAITMQGGAQLTADTLWTSGKLNQSSNSTLTVQSPPNTDAWKINDPYAGMTIPPLGACDANALAVGSQDTTLTPGVYCNGLTFQSQGTITLEPGTYYINAGDLQIKGQVTVKCDCNSPTDGVTFVLTNTADPTNTGTVYIAGGTNVNLKAPTSNTYPFPGLLIYQDPRNTNPGPAKIEGGSNILLAGGLYFNQEVQFAGNNTTASIKCLVIVGKFVTFTGTANLVNSDCQSAGIKTATIEGVFLVE